MTSSPSPSPTITDPDANGPNVLWTLPPDWSFQAPGRDPLRPWDGLGGAALAACPAHLSAMYEAGWPVQEHGRATAGCFWCQAGRDPRSLPVRP